MYIYWSFGYYDKFEHSGWFEKYTLGNMGFSQTKSEISKTLEIIDADTMSINITCEDGFISA